MVTCKEKDWGKAVYYLNIFLTLCVVFLLMAYKDSCSLDLCSHGNSSPTPFPSGRRLRSQDQHVGLATISSLHSCFSAIVSSQLRGPDWTARGAFSRCDHCLGAKGAPSSCSQHCWPLTSKSHMSSPLAWGTLVPSTLTPLEQGGLTRCAAWCSTCQVGPVRRRRHRRVRQTWIWVLGFTCDTGLSLSVVPFPLL